MTHEMKLQAKYFDYILHGTKRVELRLNDEKRKLIKVGDVLKFSKLPALTESFEAKVIGLLNYSSFTGLFKDFDISILADSSMTKDELLNVLEEFYTPEKQLEFGVLGIRLEVLNV